MSSEWQRILKVLRLEPGPADGASLALECGPFPSSQVSQWMTRLRTILLEELRGAAPTHYRIEGLESEWDPIPGVSESAFEILLSIKSLAFSLSGADAQHASADIAGPCSMVAKDLRLGEGLTLFTPETPIATVEPGGRLRLDVRVGAGVGYVPAETNRATAAPGEFAMDSIFSPVARVTMETRRHGAEEIVHLEVITRAGSPEAALHQAAAILVQNPGAA